MIGPGRNEHLTVIDRTLNQQVANSVPGMAHWAGTGPTGWTCRECKHWTGCGDPNGYRSGRGITGGELVPRACAEFRRLTGKIGPRVPHWVASCRHFVEALNPPSKFEKRGA
jgi:hypothetical protein